MPTRLDDSLRWSAGYRPRNVATISAGGTFTYGQLWARVLRLAGSLQTQGLRAGDRIALLMQNGHRYLELYHTAALLRAAIVPLNYRCIGTEIEYIVNHSGADTLVFDPNYAELIARLRSGIPSVKRFICAGGEPADSVSYESLVEAGVESDVISGDLSATLFQGYTSGTTGAPKGCVVRHEEFGDCLHNVATLYGIDALDIELVVAPLFHEAPAIFALAQHMRGGSVVVSADSTPADICEQIERHRVTWAFMVPTMWASLVRSTDIEQADLSSLRILLSGGSPLLTQTKELLLDKLPGAGLHEFYGGTELGLVTNLEPRDQRRKVRSVGRPVPGRLVELRDEAGRPVAQGGVGEIYVSGDILLKEYFNNPDATAAARGLDGFLTLGDMGRFDDEGYLYIVDRKKDMIISGGENIFPNDIEDILYRHPAVQMAAVIGAPDSNWGEIVVAAVKLKEDSVVSEQDLIAHCKGWLSSFKVPKKIDFYQELPMSSFGKVLRREVRRRYWTAASEIKV